MLRPLLAASLTLAAISLPGAATSSPAPILSAVVGPGFTITLNNPDGTRVTHLDPAQYIVSVDDRAIVHNFHLTGPGVDMSTEVETTGIATWNVDLRDGTYRYVCDPHASFMKGSFTVGTVPPSPIVPQVNGKVTSRSITVTRNGSRVRSLIQNTYKFKITDASKKQNFHLIGPGVNRKTGVVARRKATWTVTLVPGTYVYRSDKNRRLRGTIRVTGAPPPAPSPG
jgi:hypothetical protein